MANNIETVVKKIVVPTLISSVFLSGCFFGTFQSAKTLGKNQGRILTFVNLPNYIHSEDEEKTYFEEDILEVTQFGMKGAIGITDKVDLSAAIVIPFFCGAGVKYMFYEGKENLWASSVLIEANYLKSIIGEEKGSNVYPKLSLLIDKGITDNFTVYTGLSIFTFPRTKSSDNWEWNTETKTDGGICLGIKGSRDVKKETTRAAFRWARSILIEVGYPINTIHPVWFFGVGIEN